MIYDPRNVELFLYTEREGALSRVGHDLKLQATEFEMLESESAVTGWVAVSGLQVVGAMENGSVSDMPTGDCKKIEESLKKTLEIKKHPRVLVNAELIDGENSVVLTVRGKRHACAVDETDGVYTGSFNQTDFGMKPYSAFLGTLRLKDKIRFELRVLN